MEKEPTTRSDDIEERLRTLESEQKDLAKRLEQYRDHLLEREKPWKKGIEARLDSHDESLSKIAEDTANTMRVLFYATEFLSHLRYYALLGVATRGALPSDWLITIGKSAKHLWEEAKVVGREKLLVKAISEEFDLTLILAKEIKLPFNQVASHIVEGAGKNLAREFDLTRSVLEHYGSDAVLIWEKLIKD